MHYCPVRTCPGNQLQVSTSSCCLQGADFDIYDFLSGKEKAYNSQ